MYVLFNPYHPGDAAHCPNEDYLRSYLEEESTVYFQGDISEVTLDSRAPCLSNCVIVSKKARVLT